MTDPRPQAPGAKRSNQESPVDWRVRSQGLEEALRELHEMAEMRLTGIHQPTQIRRRQYEREHPHCFINAISRAKDALSLGLPDEEGEWRCGDCHVLNAPSESTCYRCGKAPGDGAAPPPRGPVVQSTDVEKGQTCRFCDRPAAQVYAGAPVCAEPSECRARLGPPDPPPDPRRSYADEHGDFEGNFS